MAGCRGAPSAAAVTLALLLALGEAAQLPSSWPRCRRKDPNLDICLRHAIELTLPQLFAGVPELEIPPAEPVSLAGPLRLETRQGGRVSLRMTLSNLQSYGIAQMKVHSVFSDLENGILDLYATVPLSVMHADMELEEGRILHEPVNPQRGGANFTFYEAEAFFVLSGLVEERDGERYLSITNTAIDILNLGGLGVHFDQLDSSPYRSTKLNYLLNSHALTLWPSLRNHLAEMHTKMMLEISNQVFGKVPLKDIFLDDDHPVVLGGPSYVLLPGAH